MALIEFSRPISFLRDECADLGRPAYSWPISPPFATLLTLRKRGPFRILSWSPPTRLICHEEDLPTQSSSQKATSWFPSPDANARRAGDDQESSPKGPKAARCLSSYESLRNSRDFRRVLDEGARRRIGGIVVVDSPGPAGPPRVGLVVSRSCGSAVDRNRIKRRLRSAARATELKPGIDYVIIANRQVADAPYEQLLGWLRRATSEQSDA